jgi:hypothetical protein
MRRLANLLAPPLGLEISECPIPVPKLQENLMWHERRRDDPQHAYLREMLRFSAANIDVPKA